MYEVIPCISALAGFHVRRFPVSRLTDMFTLELPTRTAVSGRLSAFVPCVTRSGTAASLGSGALAIVTLPNLSVVLRSMSSGGRVEVCLHRSNIPTL